MTWAVDKLQQSHAEQVSLLELVPVTVPVLGEIFVRPVVNAGKTIEIETFRVNGDLANYMLMLIMHHCVDGDEKPLFQKAHRVTLLNESNFETLSAIFNAVKKVTEDNGVDIKKL